MNVEKLKQARLDRQWRAQATAPFIGDVYKDLKTVWVDVEVTFKNDVLRSPSVKEWGCDLTPSDRLYLHCECTNKDCTGDGFDLTSVLQKALATRLCIEGEMFCNGKEDWKYIRSVGCSCMTCLKYKIDPQFTSTL